MTHETNVPLNIGSVLGAYTRASLRYPWLLTFIIAAGIGVQATNIIAPLYLSSFINTVSKGNPSAASVQSLYLLLGMYCVIKLVGWVVRRIETVSICKIEISVMADLSNSAFENLIRHSYDFFTSNFSGTLTRRVARYARSFEQVFDSIFFNFLPIFLYALGTIIILCQRNIWLGCAVLVWVIIFVALQVLMTKWRQPLRIERAAEESRMTGALADVIGNHSVMTLFASELHETHIFASVVDAWRRITLKSWYANALTNTIQGFLAIVVEVALLGIAVVLWQKGMLAVGDFVLIQVYLLSLIDQIWNIGSTLNRLYDAFADASEMVEIIATPLEVVDSRDAQPLALSSGEIIFDSATFAFITSRPVLDQFSLTIRGGEKVALIGSSGAGKSTITKVLLRLYDLTGGRIIIDGQDISAVTQSSLREHIAFVPQDPTLFHRTLRENIRYGRLEATDEDVVSAARQAHCHEFISSLTEGYDTLVGERGIKLSGGERQRIAIARAVLKNAPILVLDEATSSLDSESEALIQDALRRLMEGKTVIAIAHRLSTIMTMDRIVVIEDGKVTLSGTHEELLAQESNLYKKLWEIQAGGFQSTLSMV